MNTKVQKDGYGTFGNLSKTYDGIRPTIPDQIIDDLFSHLPHQPRILDVGCGTGIITRQLAKQGVTIVGTDIDARMIEEAKQYLEKIDYLTAPTEKLPLPDSTFDAVTAFSAFHWFANAQALAEIKRVLKNSEYLFIANRNQTGNLRKEYLQVLQSFVEKPLPSAKQNYEPADLLKSAEFVNILEKKLPIVENLSVEQALTYVRSTSLWNLIPEWRKQEVEDSLMKFFADQVTEGFVHRPIEIQTVIGKKRI
ncbi:MAG: hypothetical protein UT62_C0030G0010 [Parcubacteria group bacterium GW2011_GWC1_39_8]|nr:MAG: hypothetical protein UT62_C0030G0010 [Parcubacteria group bacterium GW2011_GWC1_39_8]